MGLFDSGDAAQSATHDDACPFTKLRRRLQPTVIQGETSGAKSELQEEVHLAKFFLGDKILRMEILHFAGNAGGESARVKTGNGTDSGFALHKAIPVLFDPHSQR